MCLLYVGLCLRDDLLIVLRRLMCFIVFMNFFFSIPGRGGPRGGSRGGRGAPRGGGMKIDFSSGGGNKKKFGDDD